MEELTEKQRTLAQNRAMHLLFRKIAYEFNDRGIEHKVVVNLLEKYATVPWNEVTIKELIWRTLQKALLLKESSTELTTKDIDKVFDVMNREIFVPLGIELDFPSIETIIFQERIRE